MRGIEETDRGSRDSPLVESRRQHCMLPIEHMNARRPAEYSGKIVIKYQSEGPILRPKKSISRG